MHPPETLLLDHVLLMSQAGRRIIRSPELIPGRAWNESPSAILFILHGGGDGICADYGCGADTICEISVSKGDGVRGFLEEGTNKPPIAKMAIRPARCCIGKCSFLISQRGRTRIMTSVMILIMA